MLFRTLRVIQRCVPPEMVTKFQRIKQLVYTTRELTNMYLGASARNKSNPFCECDQDLMLNYERVLYELEQVFGRA